MINSRGLEGDIDIAMPGHGANPMSDNPHRTQRTGEFSRMWIMWRSKAVRKRSAKKRGEFPEHLFPYSGNSLNI